MEKPTATASLLHGQLLLKWTLRLGEKVGRVEVIFTAVKFDYQRRLSYHGLSPHLDQMFTINRSLITSRWTVLSLLHRVSEIIYNGRMIFEIIINFFLYERFFAT
jgi:hypothetical protein